MRLMQTMSSFLSDTFERFSIFGYKYGSRLVTDRTENIPPTQNISFKKRIGVLSVTAVHSITF